MAVTLKKGSKGNLVGTVQGVVGAKADGIFGSETRDKVKQYQKANGLSADGIVGLMTWTRILSQAPLIKLGSSGMWASAAEWAIDNMTRDGEITSKEVDLIKNYQRTVGITADGLIGQYTWMKLFDIVTMPNTNVKPTDFKQYDSRWKSKNYTSVGNKSQTMGNSGCGPTAAADLVHYFKNKNVDPWVLAQQYIKKGFRTKDSGTLWSAFKWTAEYYGFKGFTQTGSFSVMKQAVANGAYAVVSFKKSKWTNNGHFCTIWSVDDKYVYINDPASASSSRAKGTYAEVQNAAKQYFIFYV